MTTTDAAGEEVVVRYLSPPEYVKFANAREHRVRHAIDLHHFVTYLQESAGLLKKVPEVKIDTLIANYLNESGDL